MILELDSPCFELAVDRVAGVFQGFGTNTSRSDAPGLAGLIGEDSEHRFGGGTAGDVRRTDKQYASQWWWLFREDSLPE